MEPNSHDSLDLIQPSLLRFVCIRWAFTDFRFYDPSNWRMEGTVLRLPNILRSLFSPYQVDFLVDLVDQVRTVPPPTRRTTFVELSRVISNTVRGRAETFGVATACLLLGASLIKNLPVAQLTDNLRLQEQIFQTCLTTLSPDIHFSINISPERPILNPKPVSESLLIKYGHLLKFPSSLERNFQTQNGPEIRRKKVISLWYFPGVDREKPPTNLKAVLRYQEQREIDPETEISQPFSRILPFLARILNQRYFPPDLLDTSAYLDVLQEEVFFRRELQDPDLILETLTTVILPFYWFAYRQDQFVDRIF